MHPVGYGTSSIYTYTTNQIDSRKKNQQTGEKLLSEHSEQPACGRGGRAAWTAMQAIPRAPILAVLLAVLGTLT